MTFEKLKLKTDSALIATGVVGTVLAAICCATPLLAVVLGSIGLAGWLVDADYIVIAVLVLGVALVGLGLYRHHNPPRPDTSAGDQKRI